MKSTVQDPTCESLLQEFFSSPFMYANQDYLMLRFPTAPTFQIFSSFSLSILYPSFKLILLWNLYFTQLQHHRYSQEISVSLYILSCIFIIARLFTCIFVYFSSRTTVDHLTLNGLLESLFFLQQSMSSEISWCIASTRTVSYTHAQCSHYFNHDSFLQFCY